MPKIRLPLVPAFTTRGPNANANIAKDGRIVNGIVAVAPNTVTRKMEAWVEKRVGCTGANLDGTNYGYAVYVDELILQNATTAAYYKLFNTALPGGTGSSRMFQFYNGTDVLIGTSNTVASGGILTNIVGAIIGTTKYIFFSPGGTQAALATNQGVYYFDTSVNVNTTTFTGDLNSNTSITNASSTTNLRVGQRLTHANLPTDCRITVINGTTLTISGAATATAATQTITQEHVSKIMSANFPARPIGPVVVINGRVFVLDRATSRIYQSALNDPQTWAADGYIAVDSDPDVVSTLARIGGTVYALGARTIEPFTYANTASGSQLQRSGPAFNTGCVSLGISPAASFAESVYFFGQRGGIYRLSQDGVRKISPYSIDAIMAQTPQNAVVSVFMDGFTYNGKPLLAVGAVVDSDASRAYEFFYDIESNVWTEQTFATAGIAIRFGTVIGNKLGNFAIGLEVSNTGNQMTMTISATPDYRDKAQAFTFTAQLPGTDLGTTLRKFISSVGLIGDTQSSGSVTLAYSDDDGANYTTAGTFDLTNINRRICGVGSHDGRRIWRITDAGNNAGRYQALDIEYEVAVN